MSFTITKKNVWLHNQVFKTGQESELEAAGFSAFEKRRQIQKGAIVLTAKTDEATLYDLASKRAVERAQELGVDIAAIPFGTGAKGKITVADVIKFSNADE